MALVNAKKAFMEKNAKIIHKSGELRTIIQKQTPKSGVWWRIANKYDT